MRVLPVGAVILAVVIGIAEHQLREKYEFWHSSDRVDWIERLDLSRCHWVQRTYLHCPGVLKQADLEELKSTFEDLSRFRSPNTAFSKMGYKFFELTEFGRMPFPIKNENITALWEDSKDQFTSITGHPFFVMPGNTGTDADDIPFVKHHHDIGGGNGSFDDCMRRPRALINVNGSYETGVLYVIPTHKVKELQVEQLGTKYKVNFSAPIPIDTTDLEASGKKTFQVMHYLFAEKGLAKEIEIKVHLNAGDAMIFNPYCVFHRSVPNSPRLGAFVQFDATPPMTWSNKEWIYERNKFLLSPSPLVLDKTHPFWRLKARLPTPSAVANLVGYHFLLGTALTTGQQYIPPELHSMEYDLQDVFKGGPFP